MLTVKSNWREQDFKKWMEIPAHSFAFLVPTTMNAAAAMTQSINPTVILNNICYYSIYPWFCNELDEVGECQRGDHSLVSVFAGISTLFIISFAFLGFLCTGLVYCAMRRTIKRSMTHNFEGDRDLAKEEKIRRVATQAMLYSLVYLNTFLWPFLGVVLTLPFIFPYETLSEKRLETPLYMVQLVYWALYPLQGFLNFFIFTRQKREQLRRADPDRSLLWVYSQILLSTPGHPGSSVLTSREATSRKSHPMDASDNSANATARRLFK